MRSHHHQPSDHRRRPGKHRRAIAIASTFATIAGALIGAGSAFGSTTWNVVEPPYKVSDTVPYVPLNSITAMSPSDVWAVGQANGTLLTEHFDGTQWSSVKLPSGPCSRFEADCNFTGVSGTTADDVIAVGNGTVPGSGGWVTLPLAYEWNGTSWVAMSVPSKTSSGAFQHIETFSANDAWAVGTNATTTPARATAMHWNGKTWTNVATPIAVSNAGLSINAISGSSPNDIWVVGETDTGGYGGRKFTSVIMHFNGQAWTEESVPDQSGLLDVDALSPTDAWAVAADGSILHWDGTSWTVNTVQESARLVTALSPTDIWVADVGSLAHYNGSSWTTTPLPSIVGALYGKASLSPGDVWFAGLAYPPNGDQLPVVVSTTGG